MLKWWWTLICSLIIVCESDIKKNNSNVIDLQFESPDIWSLVYLYIWTQIFFFFLITNARVMSLGIRQG